MSKKPVKKLPPGKTLAKAGNKNKERTEEISSAFPIAGFADFYEQIFNAIPIPIFVKDRLHRWILLNDSLCALQKKSKEELLYKTDYDFFPKEQADELYATEEQIFNDRTPLFVEEFTLRNGQESYVLIKKNIIRDENSNDYIVGGCIDITQRKKAEMLVEKSERRFRALVQNSPDIITILSKDATIRYLTPSFFKILGYELEQVQDTSIYRLIHIEDVFTLQQKIAEILKSPNETASITFRAITQSGQLIILSSIITNLTQDPSVNGIVINASDITQLSKQANEIKRINEILEKENIELNVALKTETKARVDLKILNFDEFHKVYPDDESCYLFLSNKKWANGYECKRCLNKKFLKGKYPYSKRCTLCGFDESPTSGTIFSNQKFSITKGFYMAFLISAQSKITSKQLSAMVTLRKDTCATFKRNFLKIHHAAKNISQLEGGWESLLFQPLKKSNKKF